MSYMILVINPGSTSTKIAVYENATQLFEETLRHSYAELQQYSHIYEQYEMRKLHILRVLQENNYELQIFNAIVGRGGLIRPLTSGTYAINQQMLHDLHIGYSGEHASNLGGILAYNLAQDGNCASFIVDPVIVDEMDAISRISGYKGIERISIFHALNQKAVARIVAKEQFNSLYEECNFIVAHMGGGISVGAHKKGRVIDVNNALHGDGPFSIERSGTLPLYNIVQMVLAHKDKTEQEIINMFVGSGGMVSYAQTSDAQEIEQKIHDGDSHIELIYNAMAYQVAKEIGALAPIFGTTLDAIILTGGLAYSSYFTRRIIKQVEWITQVILYPGEDELGALAMGALRVLNGEETVKIYT